MAQQHKVLLTPEAYKALQAECMVRDGEDLKVVASNLILDHISPKAKKVLEALEDKGINAVIQQCVSKKPASAEALSQRWPSSCRSASTLSSVAR